MTQQSVPLVYNGETIGSAVLEVNDSFVIIHGRLHDQFKHLLSNGDVSLSISTSGIQ